MLAVPSNLDGPGKSPPCWLRVTEDQGSIPEREPARRLPRLRVAAGAQLTHSQHGEVVKINVGAGLACEPSGRIERRPNTCR